MTLATAILLATDLQAKLLPFCERCEIAGGVRRGKPEPHDIEVVCIPRQEAIDLLGEELVHCQGFVQALHRHRVLKGGTPVNRYTQLALDGCNADVFCCTPANWGLIFCIRTGPKDFNLRLVEALRRNKHYMRHGELWNEREVVATPDEHAVFRAAGMEYIPPALRTA